VKAATTWALKDRLLAGITSYVAPTNPAVLNDDSFTTTVGVPFSGNVLTNDQLLPPDGNPLHDTQAVLVSNPYHGVVHFHADGSFT
jgi:hypothetical protein